MNIKRLFIFCMFLFFITISNACAFEENSTETFLEETIVDEHLLNENSNDTRSDVHLNSSNIVKYYGGSERYGAYLYDDNGDILENKTIKFLINGMEYTRVTNNIGYASIGINLSPGNYSISCFFHGDEYYKPCNRSNWVFVNTTIWGDDLVKYYRNSSQYYCLFFSVNGVALVNTTVTFNINGVFYSRTTNATGWARLNINLDPGNYIITAFNPVSYETHANIITVLSIVDSHDLVKYYRNNSQYVVRILGPTGSPVGAGENVTFNINGIFYTRTTNSSGHAKLNINLGPGDYIVTTYYNSYAVSNNIRVLSTLISEDFYKEYGDGSYFEVIVLDDVGNPYPNQTVNFNVHGIFYNRVSDNYGIARLKINLQPGEYIITSSFNLLSVPNYIRIGFHHSPKSYFLHTSHSNFYYGCDNNFLYVYLSDNNGQFISNKSILLTCGNFSSARLTDNYGCAKWFIDWNVGHYNVSLSFRSNNPNDVVNNIMLDINVLKSNSYISNYSLFVDEGSLVQYGVKLLNQFNNAICGEIISLTLLNNTFYNVTDDNGFAYFYFNLDVGLYNVSVNFYSNSNYYSSSFFGEIFVHPEIFVDKESGFYNQSNLTVNIFSDNLDFYYSFDNISWSSAHDNVSIILINGEWDLYYCIDLFSDIYHNFYIVDNVIPFVFSNYDSGIYNESFNVNLTSWDNVDENPLIYYSLNESVFVLYDSLLNINKTSCLKFFAIDFNGHKSRESTCNFIFEKVGNINSGKGFSTIQSAIDDEDTYNGDLILVGEGLFNEHLTINKSINLMGNNAILQGMYSNQPVIGITNGGSNSSIYGFKIMDSFYGVVIYYAENVSIINNQFINVVSSIETFFDKNTLIAYNFIDSSESLNSMSGIIVRKSDDIMILKNNITLNSNNNSCGIIVLNNTSNNISIVKNNIINKNKLNGMGLYINCSNMNIDSNNISDLNTGLYMISSNSKIIYNTFKNNNCGIFLSVSVNNTYSFNNIYNNKVYGVVLDTWLISVDDSFYLNRLYNNTVFDFYSNTSLVYLVDNNWWGENTPKISKTNNVFANIYNGTGNLIMNKWIIMQLFSSSYKINEYSQIDRARFYVDLTYNNLGNKLSSVGYIPNNIETFISTFNINGDKKYNISYLNNGKAFVDFELIDLFENYDNISVMAIMDNEKIVKTFNKNATIDITLFSTAWDMENNNFVNKTYHIPYNDVSWISFSWSESGLYNGQINVIVNGEIIDEINIENIFYQNLKNNYSIEFFSAIKILNNVFASIKEDVWAPNNYYLTFAELSNINASNFNLVYNNFLNYLQLNYNLTDSELNFIKNYKNYFIDAIEMTVDYHGDITPDINFEYNNRNKILNPPSSYAHRISNIYYTDIVDENNMSIGYEGMRSFAVVKNNLTNDNLQYWLNQKELYTPGLMKAAYGTFLTSMLVIYETDRVADISAGNFNVTWTRNSPVCVSLCNDYNCLYITGESDHNMGRYTTGNASDIWKFNFATSFSFSLIEQLVGNNIWNTTKIGSVTLGLIENYINNKTLELFTSNNYIFIKNFNDNNTLLFLELGTGIVRDCFSYYGLLGTMPCYHNNITENAWNYGNNILNKSSEEYMDLSNVAMFSQNSSQLTNWINKLLKLFDGLDWNNFLFTFGSGIVGSELLSIGAILIIAGIAILCPEIIIAGAIFFIFGEIFLAYSDGLLDGNITFTDGFFFTFDNVISIILPFIGIEFKIGSQFSKKALDSIILKYQNKIFEEISSQLIVETIPYFIFKMVLKDNYKDPIKIQLERFFFMNIVPIPYRERFKRIIDYYWGYIFD